MNEIVRIHIAGVPYEIDIIARKNLDKYLAAIKKSLGEESDALEDIEIRITEILADRGVNKNGVIKPADVDAIKNQLGQPMDFSSDNKENGKGKANEETIADKVRSTLASKKYFRDTENGVIGGVISGLSAYTGWDVTLLRVLAVILVFFTGFFPFAVLYVVVWICAPEALTASDRLSMKGKPANLENIVENIAKKSENIAEKIDSSARSTSKKIKQSMPNSGTSALRIALIIFGVIGLLAFIPSLIALIPITILSIFYITSATIVLKPLFVVTSVLVAILLFTIVAAGITISVSLISGKFSKSTSTGLIASLIFAVCLGVAAITTGTIWSSQAGRNGVENTVRDFRDDIHLRGRHWWFR
ncbi:PspC domain-containing protein [Candidatus Saccharibacteria bacterium]|nr:PspC domain-containing protein [Candidatus Saccharibacteria bacterium]